MTFPNFTTLYVGRAWEQGYVGRVFWSHSKVHCTQASLQENRERAWKISLIPRCRGGRKKSTWYTLFAHALNRHGIPWWLCSYVYVCICMHVGDVINSLCWCASCSSVSVSLYSYHSLPNIVPDSIELGRACSIDVHNILKIILTAYVIHMSHWSS